MALAMSYAVGGGQAEPEEAVRVARHALSLTPDGPTHTVAERLRGCVDLLAPVHRRIPDVSLFVEECRALPAGSGSR